MRRILFIATGGTISCIQGPEGLTPALSGAEILNISGISADCEEFGRLDSSLMTDTQRASLADHIAAKSGFYDGFVILHGTDTMAYTAAYLACALCGLKKNVILTGSQLPLFASDSDGIQNVNHAFSAAAQDYSGVRIAMGGRLIDAQTATKTDTKSNDCFLSVSGEAAVRPSRPFTQVRRPVLKRAAFLHAVPTFPVTFIRQYAAFDALIVKAFGSGGLPDGWEEQLLELKAAHVRIYLKSQCLFGNAEKKYAAHSATKNFTLLANISDEYAYYAVLFGLL